MTIPRSFHQHDVFYPKLARFMEAQTFLLHGKDQLYQNLNEAICPNQDKKYRTHNPKLRNSPITSSGSEETETSSYSYQTKGCFRRAGDSPMHPFRMIQ